MTDHQTKTNLRCQLHRRCVLLLRFLKPILGPILFLLVIILVAYFLPFANIKYQSQTISNEIQRDGSLEVLTETIALDVWLFGVCNRHSSEQIQRIHENKSRLADSGNYNPHLDDEMIYTNRLQLILATRLTEIDNLFCGEDVQLDPQYTTFVAAGLVTIILLALAVSLLLLCITIHTVTRIKRTRSKPSSQYEMHWAVKLLYEASVWIVTFALLLYFAFTYAVRRGPNASVGSGFIILMITTIFIHICLCLHFENLCNWIATVIDHKFKCPRRKDTLPPKNMEVIMV